MALLFLTRGEIYHEATWDAWFRSAAGLLPTAALHAADCPEGEPFFAAAGGCWPVAPFPENSLYV